MKQLRGIRGAITVKSNNADEIVGATRTLLEEITEANQVVVEDIASVIFSVTEDIDAQFPAVAARNLGWDDTPLLCTYEISVPGSLSKCIRVLMHVNSERSQKEIKHIYLKDAAKLRPELNK